MGTTAIVLAGAGARGAYEAGLISELVPRLLEEPDERIILVGTSAGAINTAILSAFNDPQAAVSEMTKLWTSVDVGDVFANILATVPGTVVRYAADVLRHSGHLNSLLDSRPLGATMNARLDWDQLDRNLTGDGWVSAAAVVATSCKQGNCVAFLQGENVVPPEPDASSGIDYAVTALRSEHVMASAAIPVAFRPVYIDAPESQRGWYIDGGVKLNAPIKPALALGADRVVVVATTPDPTLAYSAPVATGEPDIFDASGVLMQALLVDRMADDVRALRRVNSLLSSRGGTESASGGYRSVPNLYLGPPDPTLIGEAANRVFSSRYASMRRRFSDLGLLGHLIGGTRASHGELLSFVFFDREFHEVLIDLGRTHAVNTLGPRGSPLPWDQSLN